MGAYRWLCRATAASTRGSPPPGASAETKSLRRPYPAAVQHSVPPPYPELPEMKKWMKRTGIGLGSIALALILGLITVYVASEVRFRRAYDEVAVSQLHAAAGPAAV